MPFCPVCRNEYHSGEEKCPDCECGLVHELPQKVNSDHSNGAETFLFSANDGIELAMIEGLLRSAGIPYYLKNKETGSYMKVIMGYSVFGVDIYVPSNFLLKSKEILQIEDAMTNGYEAESDFYEQIPEDENEELSNESDHNSVRFNIETFLTIVFSPVLLVVLILWLLWLGVKNCIKFIKERLQ
jgi:hypothetical protein